MIPRPSHWKNIWSPISKRRIRLMNWSLSLNRWTRTSTTNIYHWCLWWKLTRENPVSCWRYSRGYQTGPESGKWNWSYLYPSSCTSLPKLSHQTRLTDSKIWSRGLQLHIDAHEKSTGIHCGYKTRSPHRTHGFQPTSNSWRTWTRSVSTPKQCKYIWINSPQNYE